MSKRKKKKEFFKWFILVIILLLLAFLTFNSNGLIEYFKTSQRNRILTEQIKDAERKIKKSEAEIDSLKNSEKKIEQIAREKYNMLKPNEEVLKVERK
jgi:cell division protein FtsB